jgi:cytochrome P450
MSNAPIYNIDPVRFAQDPYPDLARMRSEMPVAFVPQLKATLLTKRDDIFENEKKTAYFSSHQPHGLMTRLMGENMMRKDGDAHLNERRTIFPTVSPKTVRDVWLADFKRAADMVLDDLATAGRGDLFWDYAMRLSAEALRHITGLTNMTYTEMNRVSQGMMDGIANYSGNKEIEARCHNCTASIDAHIDARMGELRAHPDLSLLSVQMQAGLPDDTIRANVRLAISGGQNEPRDAIAGTIWAVLTHPKTLDQVATGQITWLQVFEEYARWISPIGMTPRRIAQPISVQGIQLDPDDMAFLMFSSANRDEDIFENPDTFDPTRDTGRAIPFGAGPHFCAGSWASKALIAQVALPMIFERLPNLRLDPSTEVTFHGWAFRGPLNLPCLWDQA